MIEIVVCEDKRRKTVVAAVEESSGLPASGRFWMPPNSTHLVYIQDCDEWQTIVVFKIEERLVEDRLLRPIICKQVESCTFFEPPSPDLEAFLWFVCRDESGAAQLVVVGRSEVSHQSFNAGEIVVHLEGSNVFVREIVKGGQYQVLQIVLGKLVVLDGWYWGLAWACECGGMAVFVNKNKNGSYELLTVCCQEVKRYPYDPATNDSIAVFARVYDAPIGVAVVIAEPAADSEGEGYRWRGGVKFGGEGEAVFFFEGNLEKFGTVVANYSGPAVPPGPPLNVDPALEGRLNKPAVEIQAHTGSGGAFLDLLSLMHWGPLWLERRKSDVLSC